MLTGKTLQLTKVLKKSIISALKREDTQFTNHTYSDAYILEALCANGAKIEFMNSNITNSYTVSVNGICVGWTPRYFINASLEYYKQDLIDIFNLMRKKYLATLPKQKTQTKKTLTSEENFIINLLKQTRTNQK